MTRRPRGGDSRSRGRGDSQRSILERIEDKLNRLLGGADDPDAQRDSGFVGGMFAPGALTWDEGDIEPRILGGPHAGAPGWDPGFAGPRFDRSAGRRPLGARRIRKDQAASVSAAFSSDWRADVSCALSDCREPTSCASAVRSPEPWSCS